MNFKDWGHELFSKKRAKSAPELHIKIVPIRVEQLLDISLAVVHLTAVNGKAIQFLVHRWRATTSSGIHITRPVVVDRLPDGRKGESLAVVVFIQHLQRHN